MSRSGRATLGRRVLRIFLPIAAGTAPFLTVIMFDRARTSDDAGSGCMAFVFFLAIVVGGIWGSVYLMVAAVRSKAGWAGAAAIAVVVSGLAWRTYREVVPAGASPIPFLLASVAKGNIVSGGGREVGVFYNDAGAAHSGNHWTWVVHYSPAVGKRVLLQGYSGGEILESDARVRWVDDRKLVAEFLPGRYGPDRYAAHVYTFGD
jgi:hypothetical protein